MSFILDKFASFEEAVDGLNKAINQMGYVDLWGQVTPFSEDELDILIRAEELKSLALCAFGTHKALLVRFEEKHLERWKAAMVITDAVNSCMKAAHERSLVK